MLMIDFIVFYMVVGYFINNAVALIAIYGDDGDELGIDLTNFILTIPIWPVTLFEVIASIFSKDE